METNVETQGTPISRLPRETQPSGIDVPGFKSGRTVKVSLDTMATKEDLQNATIDRKGWFPNIEVLESAFPNPTPGNTAWVGTPYPGFVYKCEVAGTWTATTEVPPSPEVNIDSKADKTVIYNVSQANNNYEYATQTLARASVTSTLRGLGQIITYKLATGWITEQFTGTDVSGWNSGGNWKDIGANAANDMATALTDQLSLTRQGSEEIQHYSDARICWDSDLKKLYISGTVPAASAGLVSRINLGGKTFRFNNSVLERSITSSGNYQLLIPIGTATITDYSLNDIVVLSGTTWDGSVYKKIGHLLLASGMSSSLIVSKKKSESSFPDILTQLSGVQWAGDARIYWDASTSKLRILGNVPSDLGNTTVVRMMFNGKDIRFNNTVLERSLTLSGNKILVIPIPTAVTTFYTLNDIVVIDGVTYDTSMYIRLNHILYGKGVSEGLIKQYTPITSNILNSYGSFLNNSIGENCFANGIRTDLKILGFGNSFMRNSVHYLSALAKGANVNLTVGNLYTGGTNLLDHLNALNNNTSPYEWHKYVDGINTENLVNQPATKGLLAERWDAVILHQYTPWTQPFEPYLSSVIKKIVEIMGYCPKIYLNATWAGHKDYVQEQYGFATEVEMWQYMLTATQNACTDVGLLKLNLIPTGTAIQNARTLSFADSYNRFTNGNPDWHHLNPPGGFVASCAVYESIVYPLNKIHCSETTLRIPTATNLPPSTMVEAGMIVTDSNYIALCNSAIKAVEKPNEITTIV